MKQIEKKSKGLPFAVFGSSQTNKPRSPPIAGPYTLPVEAPCEKGSAGKQTKQKATKSVFSLSPGNRVMRKPRFSLLLFLSHSFSCLRLCVGQGANFLFRRWGVTRQIFINDAARPLASPRWPDIEGSASANQVPVVVAPCGTTFM